ncbi:MAG: aconitase X catalytic domain-containing protein [Candidatus Aenigmarchaeota archaeon]|nr:aconitase X catalytic domain-containing protein [Candidatus Aenigmarchaeota archaeon]
MYLTKEQEKMLNGEYGEVVERFMRLLVKLGEIYNADKLIPITSVQIAGVSYKSIGDPGLEFLDDIASKNVKVKVPSFLNPAGVDLENTNEFPEYFVEKQKRIIDAYRRLGIRITATCTPYFISVLPRFGEHVAWSESSAVSFVNSVLGARTNREGALSSLASAVCGFTPNYGLHLDENRNPHFLIKVDAKLKTMSDFGALGYLVGKMVGGKIPYFTGFSGGVDELKALGAAMAASGAVALYHVEAITPEAGYVDKNDVEKISIDELDIKKAYEELGSEEKPDLITIGCPHASIKEIEYVARKLKNKKIKIPIWIFTSRPMKMLAEKLGYVEMIEKAGGRVFADTCMVVSPIEEMNYRVVATNSGKAAKYLPGLCKKVVVFRGLDELVNMAIN